MPFRDGTFDAVVSFLALQDVYMTSGEGAVLDVVEDSCRVLKPGGLLALADNLFPESARDKSQRLYAPIHREAFRARLPQKDLVKNKIRECGLTNQREYRFNPHINLDEKESRIELLDIIEARPFGKMFDFERIWAKYYHETSRVGLSYPDVLLVEGRKTVDRSAL